MADQDYPTLYADMEASALRTRGAAIAFEHILGGPASDMVPVNGYLPQPTIAGRVGSYLNAFAGSQEERAAIFAGSQAERAATFTATQAQRAAAFSAAQYGREVQFNSAMDAIGYEPPVPYAEGVLLDRTTKTVTYLGNEYRARGPFIPLTLSNWAADEAKLKLVGDDSLRQDMADPLTGGAILKWLLNSGQREYTRIAHRGYAGLAPENTMTAFSNAYNVGADVLESDVSVTSDGYCVIIHDATVDRTTNGTGNVKDLTLAQIQALDAGSKFSAKFASTRIPTFDELIKFAKPRFKTLYTEVKNYRSQADIDLMLAVIVENRAEDLVNLSSFLFEDLSYIRARSRKIALGYLSFNSLDRLPLVAALGGDLTMIFDYSYILGFPSAVETCRSAGVDVAVYTVNSQPTVEALIALGVTKIISNFLIGDGR